MRVLRLGSLLAVLAAAACSGSRTEPINGGDEGGGVTQSPGESPDVTGDGELELRLVFGDGDAPRDGVFHGKDRVHLRVTMASAGAAFADGDLAFVVLDASGAVVSSDALDCRRFRVGMNRARINEVYAGVDLDGTACLHSWGTHDNGTLLPQLVPFADTALVDGVMEYTVVVARVNQIVDGKFPEHAARATFKVKPIVCGDGQLIFPEECDDGNLVVGDGCSATCTREPAAPTCGDGALDAGEECDDGNGLDGDGCSATCKQEHPSCCCGDGIVNHGETCDDGNLVAGDGCSPTCQLESE